MNSPCHKIGANPRSLILGLLAATMLAGCGTPGMALDRKKGAPDTTLKSIALYTLRTVNQYKPSWQPEVKTIAIRGEAKGDQQRFKAPKAHAAPKHEYYEYLISVDLAPGSYVLADVVGRCTVFWASGRSGFPVDARFSLAPRSVTYLGHVEMINRERKEGERRSGGVFPLIDQSVSGFSGGTFDIKLSDRSETDLPAFRQTYPSLQSVPIDTNLLQSVIGPAPR
jgi:hypothetical protein